MISAVDILLVVLVLVGVVMLIFWHGRRRTSKEAPFTGTGIGDGEAIVPNASVQEVTSIPSQEYAGEHVPESEGAGRDTDDRELPIGPADGERHPLDEGSMENVLADDLQASDAGTPTNVDAHPESESGPSVREPGIGSFPDTVPGVPLRNGQVIQSFPAPPTSEEERSTTASAEPPLEQMPPTRTGPGALDRQDEDSENETAEEEGLLCALEVEATADLATTAPAEARLRRGNESGEERRRYAGLTRRPPGPRNNNRDEPRVTAADNVRQEQPRPIEVRLRFDRGGACAISLIASRSPGAPDDVTVTVASSSMDLRAMQDEWYQDVIQEDIGRILREGTVWREEEGTGRWSLSGRELYVLGARSDLSGWVSQPCLKLGRKHVVLCTEQLRPAAEEALRAAGMDQTVVLDASLGSPAGWVVIQDIIPVSAVSPADEADILNALRPLPEVDIYLENGVRLEYTTWLEGHPPLIRIYGDLTHTPEVRIDGCAASRGDDDAYRVPGWDATGTHMVWCAGTSKSYSIVPFQASWEPWDAYAFPIALGSSRHMSICGPLVREASANQHGWTPAIQLPESNLAVLGAAPGELTFATRASDIRGIPCFASPAFRPVWALPPDPLHCSKKSTRMLFLGEHVEPIPWDTRQSAAGSSPEVDGWSKLILDASRKGLAIEPDTEHVQALWRRYERVARRIWKSGK